MSEDEKRAPRSNKAGSGVLGTRLKAERLRRHWPLLKFAKAIGVNHAALSGWENRGITPKLPQIIAVARLLECSIDYLCGLED